MRTRWGSAVAGCSILLAAALTSAQAPTESPRQAEPQYEATGLYQNGTENQEQPTRQPPPVQNAVEPPTGHIQSRGYSTEKKTEAIEPMDNSQWWFNFLLVLFTFGLVVVGGLQVWLFGRSLKTADDASRAAIDSAEVAKLSLLVDRPYLLVDGTHLIGWAPESKAPHLYVRVSLRNYGKSPAIIESVHTCMETLPGKRHYPMLPDKLPNPLDYQGYLRLHLPRMVVGSGDFHYIQTDPIWSSEVVKYRAQIETGERQLIAHGRILIVDTSGQEWETGFLWLFWPATLGQGDLETMHTDRMEVGPRELNYVVGLKSSRPNTLLA